MLELTKTTAVARKGVVRVEGRITAKMHHFSVLAPGYKKWMPNGELMFACSGANLDEWDRHCADIPIEDADGSLARARVLLLPPLTLMPMNHKPRRPLFDHQLRMVSMAKQRSAFGVFHDMGTGKSCTAILMACELFPIEIDQMLFVTTTNNVDQFIEEQVPLHCPEDVTTFPVKVVSPKADKLPAKASSSVLTIGVCGSGAFQGDKSIKAIKKFVARGRTMLVVDESTAFKGWSSKRVKNLLDIRDLVTHCYLMSGEPAPNGLEDLFTQFYILDPAIIGHTTRSSFRAEYCIMGGYDGHAVIDFKHKDRLYGKIGPWCEFVAIRDCHDMPPQVFVEKRFKPTDEQKRVYKQILADWVAVLDSGDEKLLETAAAKYIALATVANGWLKLDDGSISVLTDIRARLVVEECVTEDKVIVWCRFHEDIHLLESVLEPGSYVKFYGLQTLDENTAARIRFQTDPSVKWFLATTASGGAALNLQIAHHMVYFSNNYNFGDRGQSERRTWRTGQTERCTYIDVLGFPIDRQILTNLKDKRDLSREIRTLAGLRALADQLRELDD